MNTTVKSPNGTASIVIIILLLLGVVGAWYNTYKNIKTTDKLQTELVNSLYDSIKTVNLKNNTSLTTISVLQTRSTKLFTDLHIKDGDIVKLQQLVADYKKKLEPGSSVTNVSSQTIVYKTIRDTVQYSTTDSLFPIYKAKYVDKWVSNDVVASRDSINFKLKVTNEYSAVIGYYKRKPFVDVINYNPYSTITVLRTYQVAAPRDKRWGVGLSIGAGFATDFKVRPYIGVGVNYNILKF